MASVALVDWTKPIGDAAVVVGAYSTPDGARLAAGAEPIDKAVDGQLLTAYRSAGGTGKPDEVIKIPTLGLAEFPLIVVTGLGPDTEAAGTTGIGADERIRRAVAAAMRALPGQHRARICMTQSPEQVGPAAQGAVLGSYRFTNYKSGSRKARAPSIEIAGDGPSKSAAAGLRRALVISQAVVAARDLVNTPPNDLYPESFAAELVRLAAGLAVDVELLTEADLERDGYHGILAVGRGSARGPRLARLAYRPARARARVALVGEGSTFNSGGLNLKTSQLTWTKADMAGAAAAATSVFAAARLKLAVEVIATLPMVENLPSATSYRPSDVLAIWGGRTVEVTDTEASGRITLAEAIGRAASDQPDFMIEASTLTAAQRVALGPRVIAAMGEPHFRDRVVAAGTAQGEASWAMPLPAELRAGLDSSVADLSTVAPDRWGAMLVGAAFLADFIPAGLPWVHLDTAGPAWNNGAAHGYTPKGGTGAGVVTILAALDSLAAGD